MALRVLATPPFLCKRWPRPDITAVLEKLAGAEDAEIWVSELTGIRMITSVDGGHLHLSISHEDRHPTWGEIKQAREWYFPEEMEVVMVLAKKSEYVNLHPNTFHLWESKCGAEGR